MPLSFAQFLNIRAAYAPAMSPDGRRMAFIATITGVPQVWVMSVPGSHAQAEADCWPDPVTFGADRVMSVAWSPVDDRLIFSRDAGGNENAQLFLVNADGSAERQLTHYEQAMHLFGAWSRDGGSIAYAANRRDPSRYDLYLLDLATGAERLLWQNDLAGFFFPVAFTPGAASDGRQRLLVAWMRSSMDQDL